MKKLSITLFVVLLTLTAKAFDFEMKTIELGDGEKITARLCLPANEVKTIVFVVHGTGPHSYLNKRSTFNYYDDLAEGFCEQGVAFFTYNRRGIDIGDTPPFYVKVDSVQYAKYLPLQEAEDVESMLKALRSDARYADCKYILYGLSEGTIIAAMVADRKIERVDALMLHGYAHDNMYDILEWQNAGYGVMHTINNIFDKDNDMAISKEEYESQDEAVVAGREKYFPEVPFEAVDINKNGFFDIDDMKYLRRNVNKQQMEQIEKGEAVNSVGFTIPALWFQKHFELEPNKTRLLRVDIPIHIFHGTIDPNVPVEGVYDLQDRFRICNKTNLTAHVFEGHDHDMNFLEWLTKKEWPDGYKAIFKCAADF